MTVRRLNRYEVIQIRRLSSIENFVREIFFMFNSFKNFKPVKRFQNRSDVLEFWSLDNSSSKSILDALETFEISEDYSTESYSSQAWSVRWRWQLFWRCEGQGSDEYSGEHECDGIAGFIQCRYLIRKGKMFVECKAKVASRLSSVY